MILFLSCLLLVATFCRRIDGTVLEDTDSPRSSSLTPLEPFNIRTKAQNVIRGLLGLHQGSCDPGYSPCDSVSCCPTGDSCCSLSNGCCPFGYYCDLDGCCPNGEVCIGSGGGCANSGAFPCPDGDGCCPDGDTCYRDSNNIGRCRAGGGSPPPTTKATTPKTTTTTHTAVTTIPDEPTTTQPGAPGTTPSSQITSFSTGPTSAPTAPAGSTQIVVDVTNTNITWTGAWVTVTSSCSGGNSKKIMTGNTSALWSMTYSFQGAAVYVQVASTNADYVVGMDGVDTYYGVIGGETPTPANCTFGWKSENLAAGTKHLLQINVYGASTQGLLSPWSFEMQNLVINQKIVQPSNSIGDGPGGSSGGGSVGDGDGDSAGSNLVNLVGVSVLTCFIMISLLL